jgi:hypothetical protein
VCYTVLESNPMSDSGCHRMCYLLAPWEDPSCMRLLCLPACVPACLRACHQSGRGRGPVCLETRQGPPIAMGRRKRRRIQKHLHLHLHTQLPTLSCDLSNARSRFCTTHLLTRNYFAPLVGLPLRPSYDTSGCHDIRCERWGGCSWSRPLLYMVCMVYTTVRGVDARS